MKIKLNYPVYLLILTIFLSSCSNDDDNSSDDDQGGDVDATEFIETYANIATANYADAYDTAVDMQTAIDAFLAAPSATTLETAKDAWLYVRDYYGQTEAYREANGPIDNESLLGTEGQINAWPLDEGYIDYVDAEGTPVNTGLIAMEDFELTEASLIAANEDGGDANISTGWHAIEFLLWGQDLNANGFSSSGERPFTDYTTAEFYERRATYLSIVTDLLVNDLKDLNDTWAEGGDYRTTFLALDQDQALENILNGIGFISNGEVALERIDPAIDEGQENEHSCFSDNTNQDMWANVNGINNIIVGSYTSESGTVVSGTSLIDITEEADNDIATDLEAKALETLSKLNALLALNKTFDEIINDEATGGNGPAEQLSTALKNQGVSISDAASALGISITIN